MSKKMSANAKVKNLWRYANFEKNQHAISLLVYVPFYNLYPVLKSQATSGIFQQNMLITFMY